MQHQPQDTWMKCSLCRSNRLSIDVLNRAKQRKIEWPKAKKYSCSPMEDPALHTSIDDAFTSVLQYMSTASRQCKRYYHRCAQGVKDKQDHEHCSRFHTSMYTRAAHRNPIQSAEDVHMVVHPGTYAVTAGEWGTAQQQTHVVRIEPGQTVELDFVM